MYAAPAITCFIQKNSTPLRVVLKKVKILLQMTRVLLDSEKASRERRSFLANCLYIP
jgi:hypothetical protein